MIKALIFDCFGVFYVDPVFARMRSPGTSPQIASTLHELDEAAAEGEINKRGFEEGATTLLHEDTAAVEDEFFKSTGRNQVLLDFTQELRGHYKIALLSNIGTDMMDGFFTPEERRELFDAVVLSGEVGYTKPDPEIFKLVCGKLGVLPAEAVMIDDVESNVDAAKRLGMQGVCYKDFTQLKIALDAIL